MKRFLKILQIGLILLLATSCSKNKYEIGAVKNDAEFAKKEEIFTYEKDSFDGHFQEKIELPIKENETQNEFITNSNDYGMFLYFFGREYHTFSKSFSVKMHYQYQYIEMNKKIIKNYLLK